MSQERPKPSAIEQLKSRSARYETAISALQSRREVLGTPQGPTRFNLEGKEGEAFLEGALKIGIKTQRTAEIVIPRLESKRAALDGKIEGVQTQAQAIEDRFSQVAAQHERGFLTGPIFEQAKAEKDRAIAALLGQPAEHVSSTPEAPAPTEADSTRPAEAEEPADDFGAAIDREIERRATEGEPQDGLLAPEKAGETFEAEAPVTTETLLTTPTSPIQEGLQFEALTPADLEELGIVPTQAPTPEEQTVGRDRRDRSQERHKPSQQRTISANLATQLSEVVDLSGGKPFTMADVIDLMKKSDETFDAAYSRLRGDAQRALNRMRDLGFVTEEAHEGKKRSYTATGNVSPADMVARLTEKTSVPVTPAAPRPEGVPAATETPQPTRDATPAAPAETVSLQPNNRRREKPVLNAIASAINSLSVSNPNGFTVQAIVAQLKRPDEPIAKATTRLQGDISRAIKAQKAEGTLQEKWTKVDGKAFKVYSVSGSAEVSTGEPPVADTPEAVAEASTGETAPETATQFHTLSAEALAARGIKFPDITHPGAKKK